MSDMGRPTSRRRTTMTAIRQKKIKRIINMDYTHNCPLFIIIPLIRVSFSDVWTLFFHNAFIL